MMHQCLAVLLLACAANAYFLYESECPPENSDVEAFRNLTSVKDPMFYPLIDRVLKDALYAQKEIQELLDEVDLPWKVALPLNDSTRFSLYAPFLHRCCGGQFHPCTHRDIVLHYVKFLGAVCWVVWPEVNYVYRRCTCCACLLYHECPVVGRCVESDYYTVDIIAYCPHIKYTDRYQKLAIRIPTSCRCQTHCPVPFDYILPDNSPAHQRQLEYVEKFNAGGGPF